MQGSKIQKVSETNWQSFSALTWPRSGKSCKSPVFLESQDLGVKPVRWFPGFLKQKLGLGVLLNYQLLTTGSSLLAQIDVAGSKGRSSGKHEGLRDHFYKPVCTGFL